MHPGRGLQLQVEYPGFQDPSSRIRNCCGSHSRTQCSAVSLLSPGPVSHHEVSISAVAAASCRASSCRADSRALASYSIRKFSCLKLPPCFLFDRSLKGITATLTTSKSINKLNTTTLLRSTREQGANCYTNKVKTSGHRQPWPPRNGNCHWRQKRVIDKV